MKELISSHDLFQISMKTRSGEDAFSAMANEINSRHKKEMERYKALLEATNEPDVEAWEQKMAERAIEFARFSEGIVRQLTPSEQIDQLQWEWWYEEFEEQQKTHK